MFPDPAAPGTPAVPFSAALAPPLPVTVSDPDGPGPKIDARPGTGVAPGWPPAPTT